MILLNFSVFVKILTKYLVFVNLPLLSKQKGISFLFTSDLEFLLI